MITIQCNNITNCNKGFLCIRRHVFKMIQKYATEIFVYNVFMIKVIKLVGCIPNYWTSLMTTNSSFKPCRSSNQLAKVHQLVTDFRRVMSSYEPPCVEMQIPVNVNREQQSSSYLSRQNLKLSISYTTETFQEIVNVKDFSVEAVWSSIGGFIGIFLGYSLLQLPEVLDAVWLTFWDKFTVMSWVKYVYSFIILCSFRKRKFAIVKLIQVINSTER